MKKYTREELVNMSSKEIEKLAVANTKISDICINLEASFYFELAVAHIQGKRYFGGPRCI